MSIGPEMGERVTRIVRSEPQEVEYLSLLRYGLYERLKGISFQGEWNAENGTRLYALKGVSNNTV